MSAKTLICLKNSKILRGQKLNAPVKIFNNSMSFFKFYKNNFIKIQKYHFLS